MHEYAAQILDVLASAARSANITDGVALGVVVLCLSIIVSYLLARGVVLAYRFVTRGDPPSLRVLVCHTVSPPAAEAMKAWAAKLK